MSFFQQVSAQASTANNSVHCLDTVLVDTVWYPEDGGSKLLSDYMASHSR